MSEGKKISIKNLTKDYIGSRGNIVRAVDNVSIDIAPGEFITLLGPSGCGKTTILRMIAGFEIPTLGEIYIGGEEVSKSTPDKRDTAMVFQSYALFPHLNVYDNIAYGLKIKKLSKSVIDKKVDHIMELIGLEGFGQRAPNQLSGGQQQRVALARALVMEPSVLLFDEPLSNLDAKLRISMRNEIRRIQKEIGITAVYVTHDQSEAMSISDRIIVMNRGIIEQEGNPIEIYQEPNSSFVADFIGQSNLIDTKVKDKGHNMIEVDINGKDVEIKTESEFEIGDTVKLVIRPESLELQDSGNIKVGIVNSIFMGSYQDYYVKLGENIINIQDNNPRNKKIYGAGDEAYITLDPEQIHVVVH
ncbi:MAG: ABC transporter ATP-binding protein [Tissierellaceae bacterium]